MNLEEKIDTSEYKLTLSGSLTYHNSFTLYNIFQKVTKLPIHKVIIDLKEVTSVDSTIVATFVEGYYLFSKHNKKLELINIGEEVAKTFSMIPFQHEKEENIKKLKISKFENIGDRFINFINSFFDLIILISNIFYWSIIGPFKGKPPKLKSIIEQGVYIGADALSIVGLTAFLVGLTVTLLSSYQLRQFGANVFVANLIGVAMTREMGPLMAAIIVAGRSGAAIAAEIATMSVSEEIDALKTMGINPIRFVIIPKIYAITVTQPFLTIMSDFLGILGGFIIAIALLDLSPMVFINQLIESLFIRDIITGLIKSVSFAWIIAIVGSFKGLRVQGGAKGVGLVTTDAVVTSLFMIIIADCFFSLLFTYID